MDRDEARHEDSQRLDERIKPPDRAGEPFLNVATGQKLWPLWCSRCGAIALYSTVPVRRGQPAPPPERLRLSDGVTRFWSPFLTLGTLRPPAPDCPGCGETVNRHLRTRPLEN